MEAGEFLDGISARAVEKFNKDQSLLSFTEYIEQVLANPQWHIRNCAQFFMDMVKAFDSHEVKTPAGKLTRYRIFDADFLSGEGRIFGHERVQQEIIGHLKNFVSAGRVDKLLLLHGPNGSAKTSIVQALTNAAEFFSATEEGALYQFSWVFPKKDKVMGGLGFNSKNAPEPESYAKLSNDMISCRIMGELRDHPLLLLSASEREQLFDVIKSKTEGLVIPEVLRTGVLSYKNRQIFDGLLASHGGDLREVFRHVRIERFYLSRRYKRGVSVVEPQMSVDAELRQISSDQSILAIPASLHFTSLYEARGPLVEANRGLIEYSDLLKRPIEAWKYLLVACEQAQVSVGSLSLFFDLIMIATSNELHLGGFREYPDWQSFKGRIELIRVPYLLRSMDEQGIYLNQLPRLLSSLHIAPHSIQMAARWAVLTRLEPPRPDLYPAELRKIIEELSPEEKLDIYDRKEVPDRLSQNEAKELRAQISHLCAEYQNEANYEGRFGASPREIRTLILNAAQDSRYDHLSAGAIFDHIEQLIQQKTTYDYLRRETMRGYRDADHLLRSVKRHYHKIIENEIRGALGLYSNESHADLFNRYVMHVSAWTKKEHVFDELVGRSAAPDENFMTNVESELRAKNESKEDFRMQLIAQIGAFRLENPNSSLQYSLLFPSHLKRLKDNIYQEQSGLIKGIVASALRYLQDDGAKLDDGLLLKAQGLLEGMYALGYQVSSAQWALAYLLRYDRSEI